MECSGPQVMESEVLSEGEERRSKRNRPGEDKIPGGFPKMKLKSPEAPGEPSVSNVESCMALRSGVCGV